MNITPQEIQVSTFQMSCGSHSIFEALENREVRAGPVALYTVMTVHSNWDSGWTHALSYTQWADLLSEPRSTIISWMKELIEKNWIEKKIRGGRKPNTYRLISHKCDPLDIPQDKDGRPKKCAIPMGEGSPVEKIRQIGYKAFVGWVVAKVKSCWVSGVVEFTVRQAQQALRMGSKTICDIYSTWQRSGLAAKISPRGFATTLQLYPKPYEKRRTRRSENPKLMRCDGEFYYSFNELWRVSRKDGSIQASEPGSSRWRFANEGELERVNSKILADFKPIIELATSSGYQNS